GVSGQDQIAVAVAKPHVAQDVPVVDQPEVGQRLGAVDGKPAFTLGVDGDVVLDPAEAVVGHPVQIDTRRPRAARNCDGPVELDYRAGLQRAVLPFGLLAREVAVDYDAVGLAVLARGRGYDVAVYVQRALGAEAHPNPLGQGRRRGLHRIQDLHVGRAPDRHFEGRRRGRARVFARSSRRSHPADDLDDPVVVDVDQDSQRFLAALDVDAGPDLDRAVVLPVDADARRAVALNLDRPVDGDGAAIADVFDVNTRRPAAGPRLCPLPDGHVDPLAVAANLNSRGLRLSRLEIRHGLHGPAELHRAAVAAGD